MLYETARPTLRRFTVGLARGEPMTFEALSSEEGQFIETPISWEEIVRFAKQLEREPRLSPADARLLLRLVLRFQAQLVSAKDARRRPNARP